MLPADKNPDSMPRLGIMLAILAGLYFVIDFLMTPNTPFPVHHDDYAILGSGIADMAWWWKRPVSSNFIFLISEFGPGFVYAVISALTVMIAWMVLVFLGRMFAARLHWVWVIVYGVLVFTHVSAFEHGKYLGLLTNLISHFFGLSTLLILWRAWRDDRAWAWILAAACYLLSVFAKEDFILPPLLLVGYLWIEERLRLRSRSTALYSRATRWAGCATLVAIAATCLFWNAYVGNPFIAGVFSPETSSQAYAVDLRPSAMGRAYWTLFAIYAPLASALALAACAGLWWLAPHLRTRVLLYIAMIAVLALPYAMIQNNMPSHRVYAWLPWLSGIVVIASQAFVEKYAAARPNTLKTVVQSSSLGIAIAMLVAWFNQGPRMEVANYYRAQERVNRRMIQSLQENQDAIRDDAVIGLRGLEGFSPWCANDANYVNDKLGYRKRWIVFVVAESPCYMQQVPDRKRKRGINVSIAKSQNLCQYGSLSVLDFAADGTATLRRAAEFCQYARP